VRCVLAPLTLLCTVSALGCGSGGGNTASNTATAAKLTRYTITLKTSSAGAARLSVRGRTNLPDGAIISLSAGQALRFSKEHQIRESQVAHAKTVTVRNGTFSASMGPLDYGDITVGLQKGVGDSIYGPIVVVDDAVTVCAEFQTGTDLNGKPLQPDSAVADVVGANGENLKNSPQKTVFGSLTPNPSNWLQALSRVRVGIKNAAAAVASAQGARPTLRRLHGFCFS
jgi:hypothetical protein